MMKANEHALTCFTTTKTFDLIMNRRITNTITDFLVNMDG